MQSGGAPAGFYAVPGLVPPDLWQHTKQYPHGAAAQNSGLIPELYPGPCTCPFLLPPANFYQVQKEVRPPAQELEPARKLTEEKNWELSNPPGTYDYLW